MKIYNTLTQKKEQFTPLSEGQVGIYVCGMTVYDLCHIGHARVMVNFDMVTRYLRAIGYKVRYVRNITDIDDKIIKQAQKNNENWQDLTSRMIEAMHQDESVLGVLPPDEEPKATDYIQKMIDMIQDLMKKKFAYQSDNGDVYYQVGQFKEYGELAHQDLEALLSGARVEVNDAKRSPLDFVLWKSAKPGEPSWESPWGPGRPGWHIECSAMSVDLLGADFDIHGGGRDLQFPHHQNEIAQAKAATGCGFAHRWMHLGYVEINKEKMSKSLGNFFTIRDVLASNRPEVIRYFMLASHYRSPLNYSQESLDNASAALERFYTALRDLPEGEAKAPKKTEYEKKFHEAMQDDFNTPVALSILFDIVRDMNRERSEGNEQKALELGALLKKLGQILGILRSDPQDFLQGTISPEMIYKIEGLIRERVESRKNKDWQRADEIRAELEREGIALEDTAQGTIWRSIST